MDEPTGHLYDIHHDYCERCGIHDELVSCIGPSGELLARICDHCAKEYIDSGLDEL